VRALAVAALAAALLAAGTLEPGSPEPADAHASAAPLIVGGHKAHPRAWGFAVALRIKGFGFFCTGSLIAPDRVLTAAHCMKRAKVRRLRVIAGSPWAAGRRAGTSIRVRRVRIDPDYNGRLDRRDLAVLTLRSPASATPIALPSAREAKAATRPGRPVYSAGWGARSPWGFRLAKRLKSARERTYSNQRCRRFYLKAGFSGRSMLCVLGTRAKRLGGAYRLSRTSCTGDSGGPLVARTPQGLRLVGVVSAGPVPCGVAPSIYARVAPELDFIRRAAGIPRPAAPTAP
jgi:secreted trypsin-like serine protease